MANNINDIGVEWDAKVQAVRVSTGERCFHVTPRYLTDMHHLYEFTKTLREIAGLDERTSYLDAWDKCCEVAEANGMVRPEPFGLKSLTARRMAELGYIPADWFNPGALGLKRLPSR